MTASPSAFRPATRSGVTRVPTVVLFLSVACIWGMNAVAMRVAGRYVPPLTVATLRSVIGGVLLFTIARTGGAAVPTAGKDWQAIGSVALFMSGLSTACLFLAARHTPAGLVSIFSNTLPLFVAMLSPVLLSERVSGRSMLGLAVGLAGTTLVAWRAIDGDIDAAGIVFGIGTTVTGAIGSIQYKRHPLVHIDRLMLVGLQLLMSAVLLGALSIPDDRSHLRFPWQFWLSFGYLALIGLAISFVFYSELLSRRSGLQGSAVAYLSTVVGVLFGAVILGERLSWVVLVGGAIAIAGVALVQGIGQRTPTPEGA